MSISNAHQFITELKRRPDSFYIIHYSCESLYDDNVGLSPRITSIAVMQYATGQLLSFSVHVVAERLGIAREEILLKYEDVERELLKEFYAFARDRRADTWVHWNMDSIAYGFELLEHRYICLVGDAPPVIPVEQRVNLNWILGDMYGRNYAADKPKGKMLDLMEQNGERDRNFLTGLEEIEAFKKSEFSRMHMSVLAKVRFFREVMDKLSKGKLKTASNTLGYRLDRALDGQGAGHFAGGQFNCPNDAPVSVDRVYARAR